jgi:hypothetical protein
MARMVAAKPGDRLAAQSLPWGTSGVASSNLAVPTKKEVQYFEARDLLPLSFDAFRTSCDVACVQ